MIRSTVRRETLANRMVPFFCGSSLRNKGVQAILDAVLYLLLVFPMWIWVMPRMIEWVQTSWAIHEQSSDSAWRNIIYPFKTVAPVAIFLLLLGLLATFIRDVRTIVRGK